MARGRPREFDREKALADAMLLFWRNGFHATSLRDLSEALGIGMPSVYAAFGSKENLYVEAVGLYMKASQTLIWQKMEDLPARVAIEILLRTTAQELANSANHPVGCMVTLALVDEQMPKPVAEAIRQARSDWLEVIRMRLQRAVVEGELPPSTDVGSLSRFYTAIIHSIGVQSHDGASCAELDGMIGFAMSAWPAQAPVATA